MTQPPPTTIKIYSHPTHCTPSPYTHTQSTDLTNTQPAPHTHSDSPPFPIIQWPNHLPPLSKYTVIQLIAHPALTHTHTIHWPNQHPASTTHTLWLNPIPNHPVTQPPLTINQLCQQFPQSTDLTTLSINSVSTTPSQHHPHPANTLIQPHSPTGLDISGNYSLPTFFRNFTFFNIDYIDGLVQNCSLSIANALEILHSCTKPSIFDLEDNVAQIHLPGWQFYLPWLSDWLNLTAFLGTADSEVHMVHISHEQLIWTIWTLLSAVPRKAVKFNHSLDRQAVGYIEPCLITQSTCIVNQLITHPTHTLLPLTPIHADNNTFISFRQQPTHAKYLDGASNVWAFSVRTQFIWCHSSTSQIFSHFMLSPYRTSEPQQLLDRDYTIIITVKPLI